MSAMEIVLLKRMLKRLEKIEIELKYMNKKLEPH
jgi:hypothetical protein